MKTIEVVAAVIRKGNKVFALQLNEHEASAWLGKESLRSVQWLPADMEILNIIETTIIS